MAKKVIRFFITGTVNVGKSYLFNSIIGKDVSEESPVPGTTIKPIRKIMSIDSNIEIHIYDLVGVGGISSIDVNSLIKIIKKKRTSSTNTKDIISSDTSILYKDIKKRNVSTSKIKSKSIILFIYNIVSGYKRDDNILLQSLLKEFPRTTIIVIANRANYLTKSDLRIVIDRCNFPSRLKVIPFSKSKSYISKLSQSIIEII